jgi:hypothetical protein
MILIRYGSWGCDTKSCPVDVDEDEGKEWISTDEVLLHIAPIIDVSLIQWGFPRPSHLFNTYLREWISNHEFLLHIAPIIDFDLIQWGFHVHLTFAIFTRVKIQRRFFVAHRSDISRCLTFSIIYEIEWQGDPQHSIAHRHQSTKS